SPTVLSSFGSRLRLSGADATDLFERALLAHPRDFWLHLQAAMFAKEPGIGVGLALAALAVRPDSVVAYGILAYDLWERGDRPAALVAANRVIDINPNYSVGHYVRGLALRDKKDWKDAIAAFQKAADLDTGFAWPCWNLGDVFRLQGNGSAAAD